MNVKKLPSSQRSLDEVIQSAFIAYALGRGAQRDTFLEDLHRGDRCHKSDIAFSIGGYLLVYEHDPGFWHSDERHEQDSEKTQTILVTQNTLVVRARIGATKLPIDNPRLHQLLLPGGVKYRDVMCAFVEQVRTHLPNHTFHTPDEAKGKALTAFAKEIFREIHPAYETKVSERVDWLRHHELRIDATRLVGVPLTTLAESLSVLKIDLGLTSAKIATCAMLLTCDPDRLKRNADVLNTDLGLTSAKIATCAMLLGCDPDRLKRNADVLNTDLGLTPAKIATCATLLGRDPDRLKRNADILKTDLGLTSAKIAQCATLLGRDPDRLKEIASWYDEQGFSWTNDPMSLSLNLERMKHALHVLVKDRKICRHKIKKKHVQRFKV